VARTPDAILLTVCTLLWSFNHNSHWFSQSYDESWVLKLKAGFARNLTREHRFVLFTDKRRDLPPDIVQEEIEGECNYSSCIQPYRMGCPMILVGLDTVVTGNCDEMADYCMTGSHIALPGDPYNETTVCNGVALVPRGQEHVYEDWRGQNDMEWMRKQRYKRIDFLFPGQVASYKAHVKISGLKGERIVYFHGDEKPGQAKEDWIDKHWAI
jgi:hypothetical protein